MYNRENMEIITNKIKEIKEIVKISRFNNEGTIEVLLDAIEDGIKQEPATMIQQYLN